MGAAIKERWMFGYGAAFVTHVFLYALDPSELQYGNPNIRNPHNSILQLLLHWGVVGCLIILATTLTFARNLWIAFCQRPDQELFPSVVLVTMLVHSLVSGVFSTRTPLLLRLLPSQVWKALAGENTTHGRVHRRDPLCT